MQAFVRPLLVLLSAGLTGWSAGVAAADKPRKSASSKSMPAAELGFIDITPGDLRATIKRVVLLPPPIPAWLGDRPDAEVALQDAVSHFLVAAGFDVIGPAEYQAEFDRLNQLAGGIYDPATGELREDAARTVHETALSGIASKRAADGFVLIEVVQQPAEFFRKRATWDSVEDPSNHSGSGTLPALSLQVRISNVAGKVLYERRGGIQLTSYSVPQRGAIPRVRPNDLLRDPVRIERAARMATLPLTRGARAIVAGSRDPQAKLPPQPPQYKDAPETFKVPRERILGSVKRIAIAPLGDSERKLSLELLAPVVKRVREELAPLGWEIVELPGARDELLAKRREAKPFDPFNGRLDEVREADARKAALRALGADGVDATLWLSIVPSTALQRYGVAEWDGVEHRVPLNGAILKALTVQALDSLGIRSMPASSVHVLITDTNHAPLYESRGGLQVMQMLYVTPRLGGGVPLIQPSDFPPNMMVGFERDQATAYMPRFASSR